MTSDYIFFYEYHLRCRGCPVAALRVSSIVVYVFFPAEAAVAAADPATTIAMPRLSTAPGASPNIAPHDVAHTTAV